MDIYVNLCRDKTYMEIATLYATLQSQTLSVDTQTMYRSDWESIFTQEKETFFTA